MELTEKNQANSAKIVQISETKDVEILQSVFPAAQVNLLACSSHCPLNAERQAGKL